MDHLQAYSKLIMDQGLICWSASGHLCAKSRMNINFLTWLKMLTIDWLLTSAPTPHVNVSLYIHRRIYLLLSLWYSVTMIYFLTWSIPLPFKSFSTCKTHLDWLLSSPCKFTMNQAWVSTNDINLHQLYIKLYWQLKVNKFMVKFLGISDDY